MKYQRVRTFLFLLACVGIMLFIIPSGTVGHFGHRLGFNPPTFTDRFLSDDKTSHQKILVLILTYMRSGSSLTGDIMQQNPESYYSFEPLFGINSMGANDTVEYVNGSLRPPPFDFNREAYNILFNYFNCQLKDLPKTVMTNDFTKRGLKSEFLKSCLKTERTSASQTENLIDCVEQVQNVCESSRVMIIKTIRTEMSIARKLMEELPNLKVIHLVRDPRAVLNSQNKVRRCSTANGGIQGCTERLCRNLENDLIKEESVLADFPGRLYPVLYEDIAKHPIETAQKLYDFVGYKFTENVRDFVYNKTMAGIENTKTFSTQRSNSSEHVDSWKTSMGPTFIDVVQKRCNFVIRHYGYDLVDTF